METFDKNRKEEQQKAKKTSKDKVEFLQQISEKET